MRLALAILLMFFNFSLCRAQGNWRPKWQAGYKDKLEYIYTNRAYQQDSSALFDSTHAIIINRYINETDSTYTFQWQLEDLFTRNDEDKYEYGGNGKEILPKIASRCPIIFNVKKLDFTIRISNTEQIDSVINIITAKRGGVMVYAKWFEYLFLPIAKKYYSVYQKDILIPNIKTDIQQNAREVRPGQESVAPNITGYKILIDTNSKQYTWHMESSTDLAAVRRSGLTYKNVQNGAGMQKEDPQESLVATTILDIMLTKPDAQVTSFDFCKRGQGTRHSIPIRSYERITIKSLQ